MTTVINTPPNSSGHRDQTDGGGWALSVIILIVIVGIGVFFWLNSRSTVPTAGTANTPNTEDTSANINVTLPTANAGANTSENTEEPETPVSE